LCPWTHAELSPRTLLNGTHHEHLRIRPSRTDVQVSFHGGVSMGSNSTQGWATLLFLGGFTCLGTAMFYDGSVLLLLLAVVGVGASVPLFLKAKALSA
jgi:hypothetical protein